MPNEMIPEVAVAGQRAVSLQWKLNIVLILGMKVPYLESIQPKPTPAIRNIWLRIKWPESFESTKPSRNSVTCRWNGKQSMIRRYSVTSNMAVPTGGTETNSSGSGFDPPDWMDLYLGTLYWYWLQVESYMLNMKYLASPIELPVTRSHPIRPQRRYYEKEKSDRYNRCYSPVDRKQDPRRRWMWDVKEPFISSRL